MNMVETIKAGESETTEFKTSLAEGGMRISSSAIDNTSVHSNACFNLNKTAPSPTVFCMCACCSREEALLLTS